VLAEGDDFNALSNLLIDSKLFKGKNIVQVTKTEIGKVGKYSLLLAHWKSISPLLDSVLSEKRDEVGLIIYAPQEEGFIPKEDVTKINRHRNVIIVNFRGRLLNDVIVSLITTSCAA